MQFDDIKKQLPFTISDADNEYLGLIGSYLRSPTRAIEHIYNEVARASNMAEVCHYALKHEGDDSGAVAWGISKARAKRMAQRNGGRA